MAMIQVVDTGYEHEEAHREVVTLGKDRVHVSVSITFADRSLSCVVLPIIHSPGEGRCCVANTAADLGKCFIFGLAQLCERTRQLRAMPRRCRFPKGRTGAAKPVQEERDSGLLSVAGTEVGDNRVDDVFDWAIWSRHGRAVR
jgi:hypothetical protein